MRSFSIGEWWAVGAALGYLSQGLLIRTVSDGVDPVFSAMVMALPTAVFVLVVVARSRRRWMQLSPRSVSFVGWKALGLLFVAATISYGVGNILWIRAFILGGVTLTVPATQSTAVWGAVLGLVVLRELLNRRMVLGLGLFSVGLILLGFGRSLIDTPGHAWPWAIVFGITAALCWTILSAANRFTMLRGADRFSVLLLTVLSGLVSLNALLVFRGYPVLGMLQPRDVLFLSLAGLCNVLAQISLTSALSMTEMASVNIITASGSALSPLLGFLIFGDPLNVVMVGAVTLIFLGAVMVQRGRATRIAPTVLPVAGPSPPGDGR